MILVTGGAGFIGSHFVVDWLARSAEHIVNLDKLTYAGDLENLQSLAGDDRHILVHGDICDVALIQSILIRYKPRAIINFAAESDVDRSIFAAEKFIQSNIVGVFRLLEAARAYWSVMSTALKSSFRFVQVSTDEVYGSLGGCDRAFTESDRYEPSSPYAASKASADHLVRASYRTYGLPVLTTNCANNYGPRQFPEKLIPLMITHALQGKPLPVYGDGLQVRDWLYVGDHCKAIRMVLEAGRPGHTYNVGCQGERTNIDVVRSICLLLDEMAPRLAAGATARYEALIEYVEDRPGHDTRYAIDSSKIALDLGWTAEQSFEAGLRKTVRWYLDNPGWAANIQKRLNSGEMV